MFTLPSDYAHREPFRQPRVLVRGDLTGMTLGYESHFMGEMPSGELPEELRSTYAHQLAGIDRRVERIVFQQALGAAFTRSEITYEMCGTSGTLLLLGEHLRPAPDEESMRPIRRRRMVWPTMAVLLAIAAGAGLHAGVGTGEYFVELRRLVNVAWIAATVVSIPALGALLRSWRPGWRFHRMKAFEWLALTSWCVVIAAGLGCTVMMQPTLKAVEDALARGELERARVVLEGVREIEGTTPEVIAADDVISMAEATSLVGAARLHKLDLIAAHGGTLAAEARTLARADRIAALRLLVDSGSDVEATALIEQHFAQELEQGDVAEQRARIAELLAGRCNDDVCRIIELHRATALASTPARAQAEQLAREQVNSTLTLRCGPDDPDFVAVECVRTSGRVDAVAQTILASTELSGDDLHTAASTAASWSDQLRSSTAVMGGTRELVLALFPAITDSPTNFPMVALGDAELYFVFDEHGICRGVYAVGRAQHRTLDTTPWTAERILSQVLGEPVEIASPKHADDTSSRWKIEGVKVVARWRAGVVVELRIGDVEV